MPEAAKIGIPIFLQREKLNRAFNAQAQRLKRKACFTNIYIYNNILNKYSSSNTIYK